MHEGVVSQVRVMRLISLCFLVVVSIVTGLASLVNAKGWFHTLGEDGKGLGPDPTVVFIFVLGLLGFVFLLFHAVFRIQYILSVRRRAKTQPDTVGVFLLKGYFALAMSRSCAGLGLGMMGSILLLISTNWYMLTAPAFAISMMFFGLPSKRNLLAFNRKVGLDPAVLERAADGSSPFPEPVEAE